MFNFLFSIFDIPLVLLLSAITFFTVFFVKNISNVFLNIFTVLLLTIFIASIILTQQIQLGEFLVIGIFFIFVIIFFIFTLKVWKDKEVENTKTNYLKNSFSILFFVLSFIIVGSNFYNIETKDNINLAKQQNKISINNEYKNDTSVKRDEEIIYSNYSENISLLNQNKIFQKLTHLIMFYVCLVMILYFFNVKENIDER